MAAEWLQPAPPNQRHLSCEHDACTPGRSVNGDGRERGFPLWQKVDRRSNVLYNCRNRHYGDHSGGYSSRSRQATRPIRSSE